MVRAGSRRIAMNAMRHTFLGWVLLLGTTMAYGQGRTVTTLHEGWRFTLGNPEGAAQPDFDDSGWQLVTVPHDWAIAGPFLLEGDGNTGKRPWKGEGWYRFTLPVAGAFVGGSGWDDLEGRQHYLLFDGAMAFPEVFVNGARAGGWDYGYNSFYLDITEWIEEGADNVIAVYLDTRSHDSRWYPGAGLFRKVQYLTTPIIHQPIWGTHVMTPIVKPHMATVRVRTEVQNGSLDPERVFVSHELINPQGAVVGRDTVSQMVPSGAVRTLETNQILANPQRWDLETPQRYTVRTIITAEGWAADTTETPFGVRTMRFTANEGFYLNDRRVQLKGVNLHHDQGPLGAALYPRALERQLEIMKAMGVNAIRNSHNVAAPELLELCDRMGLLVFNEIFDKYDAKADLRPDEDFDAFAHRNVRNFVKRDRNHPSIFLWSVGNEINDVEANVNGGHHRLHTMVNYVNKYDPTRPVTLVCHMRDVAVERHFDYYDVISYNYNRRYELARQLAPDKPVIISESASTLSTRGFYEFPLPEEKTDFTTSLQVSSYDVHAPAWAEVADDDFMWQQDEPYVAGEFVWTGFDYLGESYPYINSEVKKLGFTDREASRSSYFGIVDLVGLPKDRYYLYQSYWRPEENLVHILPHWNWQGREGEVTPVFVYTNGDCAELFLNGKSQGMECKDPSSTESIERFRLMWKHVRYQPGTLRVVAYRAGQPIVEATRETTGKPRGLRLTVDRPQIAADGMDLAYITVEAVDAEGRPHPLADHSVKISLAGVGEVLGVGNGNPQSHAPFQAMEVDLFYGKAVIILKGGTQPGEAQLTVEAPGLKQAATTVVVGPVGPAGQ